MCNPDYIGSVGILEYIGMEQPCATGIYMVDSQSQLIVLLTLVASFAIVAYLLSICRAQI